MRPIVPLLGLGAILGLPITAMGAQPASRSGAPTRRDSAEAAAFENRFAVATSGVWTMDGEYKGSSGIYYKLTGYFAYVASTSTSKDNGDEAVLAMYLEPLAGGNSMWISARLICSIVSGADRVRCLPAQGATQLLDVNVTFSSVPFRGMRAEAVITEPDDKSAKDRFAGRSTARGRFNLVPISG